MDVEDNLIAFLEVQRFHDGCRQPDGQAVAPFRYFHRIALGYTVINCISSTSHQHTAADSVTAVEAWPFVLPHTSHVAHALAPFGHAWKLFPWKDPPLSHEDLHGPPCRRPSRLIAHTRMEDIARQLATFLVPIGAAFVGPAVALVLLLARRRRVLARRRSPVGISLLRSPGHTLREQLESATLDLSFDLMALSSLPLIFLVMFLLQSHLGNVEAVTSRWPLYVAAAVVTALLLLRKLWRTGARLDALRAGYDAEAAVGQELDQLMRRGAIVFHDIPAEGFNIDHVVIAPEGVFAVETKGFTKPKRGMGKEDATVQYDGDTLRFPQWAGRKPLEQTERQARWLGDWLSKAMARPIRAQPVLALPGWFVQRSGRGPVWVYSGKELAGLLRCRRPAGFSNEEVEQLAYQVEQRCRSVAPRYSSTTREGDLAMAR